jgi:hypothetical protein
MLLRCAGRSCRCHRRHEPLIVDRGIGVPARALRRASSSAASWLTSWPLPGSCGTGQTVGQRLRSGHPFGPASPGAWAAGWAAVVGRQGFEPWTNGLKIRCSNRLSYRPVLETSASFYVKTARLASALRLSPASVAVESGPRGRPCGGSRTGRSSLRNGLRARARRAVVGP